jgi:hypothetical protein
LDPPAHKPIPADARHLLARPLDDLLYNKLRELRARWDAGPAYMVDAPWLQVVVGNGVVSLAIVAGLRRPLGEVALATADRG